KLSGTLSPLELYNDNTEDIGNEPRQETVSIELDDRVQEQLLKISKNNDLSLYVILLTIVKMQLFKLSNQKDIIVSAPVFQKNNLQYNKYLPLRDTIKPGMNFKQLLGTLKGTVTAAYKKPHYPLENILKKLKIEGHKKLTSTLMVLENIQGKETLDDVLAEIDTEMVFYFEKQETGIKGSIKYNRRLFKPGTVETYAALLNHIAGVALEKKELSLEELELVGEKEKQRLLMEFNGTTDINTGNRTLHQLIDEHAEKNPTALALQYEEQRLTYEELKEESHRLAQQLKRKGIKRDTVVGIMLERSLEMVVGMIAAMNAGGAYLPLDPGFPAERLHYMIKDSSAHIIVTSREIARELKLEDKTGEEILYMEEMALKSGRIEHHDPQQPVTEEDASAIAYIIYTSGSTGKAKGAAIEHRSILNTLEWRKEYYGFGTGDVVLQIPSFTFDSSVEDIFTPLISGAKLVLLKQEKRRNLDYIAALIKKHHVTNLIAVPNFYQAMLKEIAHHMAQMRIVTVAGDNFSKELVTLHFDKIPDVRLINEYGPTENSVCTTAFEFKNGETGISIGKPINNTVCYILGPGNKLIPLGLPGELCIAGHGLSRGYLNQPTMTMEKFIPNPYATFASDASNAPSGTSRLYHTGDLARWRPDGNMEFIGRVDQQVKIRGFRIEPGEIEDKLMKHDAIKEAVVVAKQGPGAEKYLCAYFVTTTTGDLPPLQLKDYMAEQLPEYMIPAYFVQMNQLPLTPSGKIDRRQLPEPETAGTEGEYIPPRSENEEMQVRVWQDVLDAEQVGITDDFFTLGGDSIKAVRISSRLRKHGLKVEINDIFLNPSIRQLEGKVREIEAEMRENRETIEGETPLTPIQQWFFHQENEEPHHFNQAVILYRKEGFEPAILDKVMEEITKHHDVLRMIYEDRDGRRVQYNRGIEAKPPKTEVISLKENSDAAAEIEKETTRLQRSFELKKGPLLRTALFQTSQGDHLAIIIHHLVVDGISWRILLEDLAIGYRRALEQEEIRYQGKTHSYKEWALQIQRYSQSNQLLEELEYWEAQERKEVPPLPVEKNLQKEEKKIKNYLQQTMTLTKEETAALLYQVNQAYGTGINDILLAALSLAVKEWAGIDKLWINLEGHGRQEIIKKLEVSRTVGWFTAMYPLLLEIDGEELTQVIPQIKKITSGIPRNGIGYGILKYMTPRDKTGNLKFDIEPTLTFNYLGQFGQENKGDKTLFTMSPLKAGPNISPELHKEEPLDITGMMAGDALTIDFTYNGHQFREDAIRQLVDSYRDNLVTIIQHCRKIEKTTIDEGETLYHGAGLTMQQKENLEREIGKEKIHEIYKLAPMQMGMLYHSLITSESGEYLFRITLTVKGELEPPLIRESLQKLIARYDTLRTLFIHENLDEPLQVVLKEREADYIYEDIAELKAEEQNRKLEKLEQEDIAAGFDLSRDHLLRVRLFKVGPGEYRLMWSFHHILMDGWSSSVLFKEMMTIYKTLKDGQTLEMAPVVPYRNYIRWLEGQDKEEGIKYWKHYLEGYNEKDSITGRIIQQDMPYKQERCSFQVEKKEIEGLQAIATANRSTLNTVFQAIWGILLHRYGNTGDVILGVVVSGRPSEIDGIERMVGLFINTIPMRIKVDEPLTFNQLLQKLQQESLRSKPYEYLPLAEIRTASSLEKMVDHIMVLENYPIEKEFKDPQGLKKTGFALENLEFFEQTNYHLNIVIFPDEPYIVEFTYNANIYETEFIERATRHFKSVIRQVLENPGIKLPEIEIIEEKKKEKIIAQFMDDL
ncbi:MAG: amino acid adenylation domain-containing protein, partial [bacterium]|nr:amino acid adenylation domain-containing protein [bacterium]